ncbi:MAG: ATP-binding cassette domain-containing protein, partial [Sterolibacterium sp.]|nr:ATP-binding cassette domain-containing protein [Sterolibacterium sp.]
MKLVAYLYRQSWKLLVLAVCSGLIAGLSGAALIALISKGISGSDWSLPTLASVFFGVALLHLISKSTTEISLLHLTQTAIYQLRLDLSRKVLTTPQKNLQALGKPGLLVMLTKDIDSFTEAFVWMPIGFGNFIITSACFAYLAWLSLPAFLMLVLFLGLGLTIFFALERYPRSQLVKVREKMDKLYAHFRDLIEGSKELQLNARRGDLFVEKVIASEAREFKTAFTRGMTGYNMAVNVGAILFFVMIGLLLFLAPQVLPQPPEAITATVFTLLYLVRPISELVFSLPIVHQAGIALERLQQLNRDLSLSATIPTAPQTWDAGSAWTLELRGLRHHYPSSSDDSQFVLGPLDLSIRQGEILYIVGGNGSGKTTLAMLILGLYRPDEGSILLNGT